MIVWVYTKDIMSPYQEYYEFMLKIVIVWVYKLKTLWIATSESMSVYSDSLSVYWLQSEYLLAITSMTFGQLEYCFIQVFVFTYSINSAQQTLPVHLAYGYEINASNVCNLLHGWHLV